MLGATFPATCYDLLKTLRFLRSVAEANAMQKHTRVTWTPCKESAALNGIYKVLFRKEPPGTAEITSDDVRVQLRSDERYMQVWLDRLEASPVR